MAAVISSQGGLRTERRVSHVFVMDVPAYDRMLFVTDAAINIEPTLRREGRHRCATRSTWPARSASRRRRWPSSRRSRRSTRTSARRSTPPHSARWPIAARSRGAHPRRAARLRQRDQRARRAHQEHPLAGRRAARTSCWCRTSRPATCWPSSCSTSPAPTAPASCSARACRWCSPAAPTTCACASDLRPSPSCSCTRGARAGAAEAMSAAARAILVLNAGSSSIKFCVFECGRRSRCGATCAGNCRRSTVAPQFVAKRGDTVVTDRRCESRPMTHQQALAVLLECLRRGAARGANSPGSVIAWSTAASNSWRRLSSIATCSRGWSVTCRSRHCTSRTTSRRSA